LIAIQRLPVKSIAAPREVQSIAMTLEAGKKKKRTLIIIHSSTSN
jgi:hypothetical protein